MVLNKYMIGGRLHEVGESQQEELVENWQEEDSLILNPFARTYGNSFLLLIPMSTCEEKWSQRPNDGRAKLENVKKYQWNYHL
jgi:hypothetical protein